MYITFCPYFSIHQFDLVFFFPDTNKRSGKAQKCDDCVLFIQLGATFAFFTLSFLIAFCIHSHDNSVQSPPPQDDFEEYYLYYSDDKML